MQLQARAAVPLLISAALACCVALVLLRSSSQDVQLLSNPGLGKVFQHHPSQGLTPAQARILKKDSAELLNDFFSPHPHLSARASDRSASALALAGSRYSNEMGGEWVKGAGHRAATRASLRMRKTLKAENQLPVTEEGALIAQQEQKTANQMSHRREFKTARLAPKVRPAVQRPVHSRQASSPPRFSAVQHPMRFRQQAAHKKAVLRTIDPPSPIGEAMNDFDSVFFGQQKAAKHKALPGVNLWGLHASKDIRNMQKEAWQDDLKQMKLEPHVEKPADLWTGVAQYKGKSPRMTTLEEEEEEPASDNEEEESQPEEEEEDPEAEEEEKEGEEDEKEEETEANKDDEEEEEKELEDADAEEKIEESDGEKYWKAEPLDLADHSDEKKLHEVHFLSDVMDRNTDEGRLPGVNVDSLGPLESDAATRSTKGNSFVPSKEQERGHQMIPSDQDMYDHWGTGQSFNGGSGAEADDKWVPAEEVRAHPNQIPNAVLPPQ